MYPHTKAHRHCKMTRLVDAFDLGMSFFCSTEKSNQFGGAIRSRRSRILTSWIILSLVSIDLYDRTYEAYETDDQGLIEMATRRRDRIVRWWIISIELLAVVLDWPTALWPNFSTCPRSG